MSEGNGLGIDVESEDGGVPLSGTEAGDIDVDYEASSSGSSASMSVGSTSSVQPSWSGSGTTSPSIPLPSEFYPQVNQAIFPLGNSPPPDHSPLPSQLQSSVAHSTVSWQVYQSQEPDPITSHVQTQIDDDTSHLFSWPDTIPPHQDEVSAGAALQAETSLIPHYPGIFNTLENFSPGGGIETSNTGIFPPAGSMMTANESDLHDLLAASAPSFDIVEATTTDTPVPVIPSQATVLLDDDSEDDWNAAPGNVLIGFETLHKYSNYNFEQFIEAWKKLKLKSGRGFPNIAHLANDSAKPQRPEKITVGVMEENACDIQGIIWSDYQTTKGTARNVRRMTAMNYTNMNPENEQDPLTFATPAYKCTFKSERSPNLTPTDGFFRFRETNLKDVPEYAHAQLRHNLCASSKNAVFYYRLPGPRQIMHPETGMVYLAPGPGSEVHCFNPGADRVTDAMDLCKKHDAELPRVGEVACLTATDGMLIVGSLQHGHYAMKSLSSSYKDEHTGGIVNEVSNGGINHIHTLLGRRSGLPQAVFCANDRYIRVLDCTTNKWISSQSWSCPVNASATSPDGRLRIHVSDNAWPIVSDAETGRLVARLPDQKDHGFACAWSPDGITMATGCQGGIVQVWDARNMKKAVHALPAEMGGVRSLQFSPLGSGPPVLVMAEPLDFVSIVDARTFLSKQDIEFFGEVSGISMPPDGDSLFIGNADRKYGGIIEYERTGHSSHFKHRSLKPSNLQQRWSQNRDAIIENANVLHDYEDWVVDGPSQDTILKRKWLEDDQTAKIWQTRETDWATEFDMLADRRAVVARNQRWSRHIGLEHMVF